jgi:hypothetical protein
MIQISDGGYVVVGPYPHRDDNVLENLLQRVERRRRSPQEPGISLPINSCSRSLYVQEILLATTDGIEGAWKTLKAFQERAQSLFASGHTDPNRLVRQLLWESNGGSGSWADDTTIFAHQAR